jgi:hypothetical protein
MAVSAVFPMDRCIPCAHTKRRSSIQCHLLISFAINADASTLQTSYHGGYPRGVLLQEYSLWKVSLGAVIPPLAGICGYTSGQGKEVRLSDGCANVESEIQETSTQSRHTHIRRNVWILLLVRVSLLDHPLAVLSRSPPLSVVRALVFPRSKCP